MLLDLDHDLHIGRLARVLSDVPNIRDPHARRHAFRRSGLAVSDRDSHAAAENARQRRAAFAEPGRPVLARHAAFEPSPDDLVERMAEGLALAAALGEVDLGDERATHAWVAGAGCHGRDPTRPALVEPATERARAKPPVPREGVTAPRGRGAALDRLGDVLGFGLLIGGWTAAYCVLCPPEAHAAPRDALITDDRLAALMSLSPVLLFVAVVVAVCWFNRGVPAAPAEDEAPVELAPETSPHLHDFWTSPARRDRG